MAQLRGSKELRRRLKAIKTVFKPAGKDWTEHTVAAAKRRLASSVDTGKTRASVRRRNASQKKASVVGRYPVNFIPGLDEGLDGIKVGTRRRFVIPPELAWGAQGNNWQVPPNTSVIFDVEALWVQGPTTPPPTAPPATNPEAGPPAPKPAGGGH